VITFLASPDWIGLQGVAGVDRPHEGVGADDLDDVRDRGHIELGGDPRRVVLAVGGGRRQDGVIAPGSGSDGGLDGLGQLVLPRLGALGQQDLAYALDLRGGVGGGLRAPEPTTRISTSPPSFSGGGHGLVRWLSRTVVPS
jgi:hypothetical protein